MICSALGVRPFHSRYLAQRERLHEEGTTAVCVQQGSYTHLHLPNELEANRACVTPIWKDPRTKEQSRERLTNQSHKIADRIRFPDESLDIRLQ